MGHTSPECLETFDRKLNEPTHSPVSVDIEEEAIGSVISQRNYEIEQSKLIENTEAMVGMPVSRPSSRMASISSPDSEITGSTQGEWFF